MKRSDDDKLTSKLRKEDLERLRDLVVSMHENNGGVAPHDCLVSFASVAEAPNLVTVDFQAAHLLGLPMVVIQVGKELARNKLFEALSPRERSVASLIAMGLANKQIATQLGITLLTVKDHVHRILVKTGLPNRAAVAAASRSIDASEMT